MKTIRSQTWSGLQHADMRPLMRTTPRTVCSIQWDQYQPLMQGQSHVPLEQPAVRAHALAGPLLRHRVDAERTGAQNLVVSLRPEDKPSAAVLSHLVAAANTTHTSMPVLMLDAKQRLLVQWRPDTKHEGDALGQLIFPERLADTAHLAKRMEAWLEGIAHTNITQVPWIVHLHGSLPVTNPKRAQRLEHETRMILQACANAGLAYAAITNGDETYTLGEYDDGATFIDSELVKLAASVATGTVRPQRRKPARPVHLPLPPLQRLLAGSFGIARHQARQITAFMEDLQKQGVVHIPRTKNELMRDLSRPEITRTHFPLPVALLIVGARLATDSSKDHIAQCMTMWEAVYDDAQGRQFDLSTAFALQTSKFKSLARSGAFTAPLQSLYRKPLVAWHFSYACELTARLSGHDGIGGTVLYPGIIFGEVSSLSDMPVDEWRKHMGSTVAVTMLIDTGALR